MTRAPSRKVRQRRELVGEIIARQRERWNAIPREQHTFELRHEVALKLYNEGKGLRVVEIAEVFGCSGEGARLALHGWASPTKQEREILAAIRAVDKGPGGPYALIILSQARAAATFQEEVMPEGGSPCPEMKT